MKLNVKIALTIAFALIIQLPHTYAQWKRINGIYGKYVNTLFCLGNKILVGTNEGLFYSTDAGYNWSAETSSVIGQRIITSFSIVGNKLYAVGGEQVFSSSDNANTWQMVCANIAYNTSGYSLCALGSNLFIASESGVLFSSDNGKSWAFRNNGLVSKWMLDIVSTKNSIFVGTAQGIYKSLDEGLHWESLGNGTTLGEVRTLVTKDSLLFAGSDKVYRSTDDGVSWNNMSKGIPSQNIIHNLNIIGTNVYAVTYPGIYCSTDYGETWSSITWKLTQTGFSSIAKCNDKLVITTYDGEVFSNNGDDWIKLSSEITSTVYSLNKHNNGVLAATSNGVFLVEPTDKGWKTMQVGLNGKPISSVCSVGDRIIAGTNDGIYITTNFGQSWFLSNNGLLTSNVIRVLYANDSKIYAGTQIGELFVSEDYGKTWVCIRSNKQGEITRCISFYGSTTLLGTSGNFYGEFGSIYKSSNNGNSWEEFHEIFYKTDIYSIAHTGSTICLGTGAGLFVSNDSGLNWKRINKTSISAVYAVGSNLLASSKEVSNTYGVSWSNFDNGLPIYSRLNSIVESGKYIYISTDSGIYAIPSLEILTSVNKSNDDLPGNFTLSQNYPNPFNPSTTIGYQLSTPGFVTLKVYDVLGREVATLVDEYKQPGYYNSKFSTQNLELSSGVYFYQLRAGDPSLRSEHGFVETRKMIYLK